jgi:hypothetical protein
MSTMWCKFLRQVCLLLLSVVVVLLLLLIEVPMAMLQAGCKANGVQAE